MYALHVYTVTIDSKLKKGPTQQAVTKATPVLFAVVTKPS